MSKTIASLINDAQTKWDYWLDVSNDKEALSDLGKTKEDAVVLANFFFEGKFDGLCEALHLKT